MAASTDRALVVDDDGDTRLLLRKILQNSGRSVDVAADADEAFALIGKNDYAVILLDLIMPHADGFSLLKRLESSKPELIANVIVITGYPEQARELRGIRGVLEKPIDTAELLAILG